ncbi:MAG: TetR/AcrR family transcriptional regulator [Desulfobacteraceae bacterium]|jgi:AcrR family transcriptional regulator
MDTQKKYQFGDLRLRLLKTASEIISDEGIKKLTMRSLSKKVGVSRTAPYRHFENKDALLLAIAGEGFNELTIRYRKINRDKSLDSLSRLQNIGLAYIEFAIKNPGAFRLMFGQEIIQHQRSEKLCSDARETFNEYLKTVKALQNEKSITIVDYSILANYFWTMVHGLAILLIDGQIQTSGENCGLPALLRNEMPNIKGDIQSMIAFSKQTIMNFWQVILNGISY